MHCTELDNIMIFLIIKLKYDLQIIYVKKVKKLKQKISNPCKKNYMKKSFSRFFILV